MVIFSYLVKSTLNIAIDIILTLMFICAIMSWIAPMSGNGFVAVIRQIVDAVTYPVRRIISKFEFARSCPIDLSFTVTALILVMLQSLLLL